MKRIIKTENAPKAIGPYSQAVLINGMLFISGQIAIDPKKGEVIEGGIKEQTEQVLNNISAIVSEAGFQLSDIVKTTCLLKNMTEFTQMNEVYEKFFAIIQPARATYEVSKLPLDVDIEIEAIAVKEINK